MTSARILWNCGTSPRNWARSKLACQKTAPRQIETAAIKLTKPVAAAVPPIAPGQYVRLAIRDTGSGMTDTIITRIFEPFFTTKPEGQGTGLGLATSARIIKKIGGHIAVESAVGTGTTFYLYFPPAVAGPAAGAAESQPEPASRGTEMILLVDENPVIREMAAMMLESEGYPVLTVATGEEAQRVLVEKSAQIKLLLCNVVMPRMGGQELAAAVRRSYPRLKILFASGFEKHPSKIKRDLAALGEVIQTPYIATVLTSAVRKVLDEPARPA